MRFTLANIDRRIVYFLIFVALSVPLALKLTLTPAPMPSAKKVWDVVENIKPESGKFVLLFFDFGPNSKAENFPQAQVLVEHLLRKRIPFAVTSQYLQAEPLLESIPAGVIARLMAESPGQTWEYGKDWVNLGFRIGGFLFIKGLASASDMVSFLKKDARGNDIKELAIFRGTKNLSSVQLMAQLSSLTGTLETLIQFLQSTSYRPPFIHGCTSITIPQAYIFLDSGQLVGLFEGVAGAASYSTLLEKQYPNRKPDDSLLMMTGIGVAHLVVIGLVALGNIAAFISRRTA